MNRMKAVFATRRSLAVLITVNIVLMGAAFLFAHLSYDALSHTIVLRYDAAEGVDLFGARSSVWGIWALGLAMMAVNGILAYEFFYRERFLSYLLMAANVLLSLIVIIVLGMLFGMN